MSYNPNMQYMTQPQPNVFQWTQNPLSYTYTTSAEYSGAIVNMAPPEYAYPPLFLDTSDPSVASVVYSPRTPTTPLSEYASPHPIINESNHDLYFSPSPSSKTAENVCHYPGCTSKGKFKRRTDLTRHIKTQHQAKDNMIECPHKWCGRTGDNGFSRKDHFREHLREVHRENIPFKSARRESGRRSPKKERSSTCVKTESHTKYN